MWARRRTRSAQNPDGYIDRRLDEIGDADVLSAFDDPKDQAAILIGMALWRTHGASVTSAQLMAAVRLQAAQLQTRPLTSSATP